MKLNLKNSYEKFTETCWAWNLKQSDVSEILGVHRSYLTRLNKKKEFTENTKQYEIAIVINEMYEIMNDKFNFVNELPLSTSKNFSTILIQKWMNQHHYYDEFEGVPIQMIKSISGLIKVMSFWNNYNDNYYYKYVADEVDMEFFLIRSFEDKDPKLYEYLKNSYFG